MNEEPKSIWKKSWKGRGSFLGWLVLATGLAFFISLLGVIILDPRQWRGDRGIVVAGTAGGAIVALMFLFIRRLCCGGNFKRLLFGLACPATLIALFYAEEDWRGWHAWNQFKHEWEAKGEHFDFASVVPLPVPEDQNFALTPIIASSYLYILDKNGHRINPPNTNVVNRLGMPISVVGDWKNCPTNGYWAKGTKTDLTGWQGYYRLAATKTNLFPVPAQPQSPGADVLLALSRYDTAIEELRAAGRLPGSRFPLNYDSEYPSAILLPHLSALKSCGQVLQLRSLAELQNGQPDKALADVKLGLQLTDKIRTEPFLISHLVRIAILQIMLQPLWEGLAEHRWSEEQLAALDADLAGLDFLADYQLSMRGELGCQSGEMDCLRRHPERIRDLGGLGNGEDGANATSYLLPDKFIARLVPAGWLYQNQLRCARMMVEHYIPMADMTRGVFSPAQARRSVAVAVAEVKTATPFNVFERLMLPALDGLVKKFAYGQTAVDLARTAIALERYRFARGEYPESLDALSPQFITKLPHDVINGQPLYYRRDPASPGSGAAGGQFVLYSVGWNETDDGGQVGLTKNGNVDVKTGDWVWRYPAQ